MAIGWYICGYKEILIGVPHPTRYCAMDDFTAQIVADGGAWSESEVLGGYALVKVRASTTTLTTIGAATGFQRLPTWMLDLDATMGSLTTGQRTAILTKVQEMGYTLAEVQAVFGTNLTSWRTRTIRQLFAFIAQRRLKPRWDDVQKQIVLDGLLQECRPIAEVDTEVTA